MNPKLMDILVCPNCRSAITLTATKRDGENIVEGTLTCVKCQAEFPILEGIPQLLPTKVNSDET